LKNKHLGQSKKKEGGIISTDTVEFLANSLKRGGSGNSELNLPSANKRKKESGKKEGIPQKSGR